MVRKHNETQLFIETPYRNDAFLADMLEALHPETCICVAVDLTLPLQSIVTKSVKEWKKSEKPEL